MQQTVCTATDRNGCDDCDENYLNFTHTLPTMYIRLCVMHKDIGMFL